MIKEGGFYVGKSSDFNRGIYPNLSRTIDTGGINGVYIAGGDLDEVKYIGIAVNPLSKKLEFNGYKDTVCPTLLATDYKCPKTVLFEGENMEIKLEQAETLSGGVWDKIHESARRVYSDNGLCPTIHTCGGGNLEPKVKTATIIRKLMPKECWRLMGFSDEDFDRAQGSGMSNSQLYKQAGNSIVVNVLESIFRQMIKKE